MSQRLDHPLAPLLLVVAAYLIFLVLRLQRVDITAFIVAGEQFVERDALLAPILIQHPIGYDGQFYYRLALNPLTREPMADGVQLDSPLYRHRRILYPSLTWLLSLGQARLVPAALVAVNFLALAAIGGVGGLYAQAVGKHALLGAFFALYPGFILTIARDLTEILEGLFVLAALLALRRQRWLLGTGLLVTAVLAKETALLLAGAIFLAWLDSVRRAEKGVTWYVGVVPLLFYVIWQLFLQFWWQASLAADVQNNIGLPFAGIVEVASSFQTFERFERIWVAEAVVLGVVGGVTAVLLNSSQARRYEKLAWLLCSLLLIMLTRSVWVEGWAFLRAASLFYLLAAVLLIQTDRREAQVLLFLISSVGWVLLASDIVWIS
jgi:hypothetical protein